MLDLTDEEMFDAKAVKAKFAKALTAVSTATERKVLRGMEQRELQQQARQTMDGVLAKYEIFGDAEVGELAKRALFAKLPELKTVQELETEAAFVAKVFSRTKAIGGAKPLPSAPAGTGGSAGGGSTMGGTPREPVKSVADWRKRMAGLFQSQRAANGG